MDEGIRVSIFQKIMLVIRKQNDDMRSIGAEGILNSRKGGIQWEKTG